MSETIFTHNSHKRIVLIAISTCLALLMSLSWVASAEAQTSAEDVYEDPAASGQEAITSAGISSASASATASASASASASPSSESVAAVTSLPSTGGPAIFPGIALVSFALLVTGGLMAARLVTSHR